jgi:adenine-specific DNA-methyltransferase
METLSQMMLETPNLNQERLDKLKELFPDLFTGEGKLNEDELKKLTAADGTVKETERYDFRWFGKSQAKRNAFTPTNTTLVFDEARSVNPATSENIIIEGENLEVLKLLLCAYREKIKCIYIDPPYNTGKDFVYSDNYTEEKRPYWEKTGAMIDGVKQTTNPDTSGRYHSDWLNMMYSRLLVARSLLRNDGVIFISIDDNEVHNLRKLCDEVFGEENFVANIIWEKNFSPKNDAKWLSENHDYIIVYAKSKEIWRPILLPRSDEANARYSNPDNDERGDWTSGDLSVKTYSADYDYEITTPSGKIIRPPKGNSWRLPKNKFDEFVTDNRIWFGKDGNNVPRLKRFLTEVKAGLTPMTFWFRADAGDNQQAAKDLRDIFNTLVFENPGRVTEEMFEKSDKLRFQMCIMKQ